MKMRLAYYMYMRAMLFSIAVMLCHVSFSQSIQGLSTVSTESKPTGKTYALIIGISKYKNPAIPGLQFADRAVWNDVEWIDKDPDLDPIRNEPEFVSLLKKYFPDKHKNE